MSSLALEQDDDILSNDGVLQVSSPPLSQRSGLSARSGGGKDDDTTVSSISNPSRGTISTGFKLAAPQISDTYEDDDEDDEDNMEGQQPSQPSFQFKEEQDPSSNYSNHSKPSIDPMMTSERTTSGEASYTLSDPPTPSTTHDPSSSHPSSNLRNQQHSSDIHSQVSHPQSYPSNDGQSHHSYRTGVSTAYSTIPPPSTIYNQHSFAPQARSISTKQKYALWCIGITICILFFALVVGVVVALTINNNDPALAVAPTLPPDVMPPTVLATPPPTSFPSATPTTSAPSTIPPSFEPTQESVVPDTLERIQIANLVKCGVVERLGFATAAGMDRWTGMEVDLCKAIAAAALQNGDLVDIISLTQEDRFTALASGEIDVLAGMTTFTMERDVHEPTAQVGFSFSTPYLYNGMGFGGIPQFVDCAESFNTTGAICEQLSICVVDGTTHLETVQDFFPSGNQIVALTSLTATYDALRSGFCNVIASDSFSIASNVVFANGYTGVYSIGSNLYTNEPIALVTREDDVRFSDFINWIVQALLHAEESNISQDISDAFGFNPIFGPIFGASFAYAIGAVGNYAELYARHLEGIVPRQNLNRINVGDSGLIYNMPFGNLLAVGSGSEGTLAEITSRGYLKCGITRRSIFAEFNTATQQWQGIDIDLCRAISAAIFDGSFSTIEYVDLPATERFLALANGEIDLLSRITTVTLERDVQEPTTGEGFTFSLPVFYDVLAYGGIPVYADCAAQINTSSEACQGLLICVNQGTTFQARLNEFFPPRFLVPRLSGEQAIDGLRTGDCNVVAGGTIDVSLRSVEASGYNGPYNINSTTLSKDPIALVTRQDDPQWSSFVYWIVNALFYAEQKGITQATSTRMPVVDLFGRLNFRIFRDAVAAVGSFQQIYQRNAQAYVPRRGLNLLNQNPLGPQHYPYPGF